MPTTRLLLADDQLLVRAGIRALLEGIPGYVVEAECADGHQALTEFRRCQPDVVLLDIAMPGPSGIEVARILRQSDLDVRILILSSIDRQEIVEQALDAGVNGYLLKDFILDELQLALSTIFSGKIYLSPKISSITRSSAHGESFQAQKLTPRQTEILRLVAYGKTTKEIAKDLNISPKTVEFHRGRLMDRIGVRDITGLTRFAVQNGFVH